MLLFFHYYQCHVVFVLKKLPLCNRMSPLQLKIKFPCCTVMIDIH